MRQFVLAPALYLTNWHPESQSLVWMSPYKFLQLSGTPEIWSRESLEKLKSRMRKGLELDPLFLDVIYNTGQVIAHEGRHRAKAAIELGIEEIPVIIYHRNISGGYVPVIGPKKIAKPLSIDELKKQPFISWGTVFKTDKVSEPSGVDYV